MSYTLNGNIKCEVYTCIKCTDHVARFSFQEHLRNILIIQHSYGLERNALALHFKIITRPRNTKFNGLREMWSE